MEDTYIVIESTRSSTIVKVLTYDQLMAEVEARSKDYQLDVMTPDFASNNTVQIASGDTALLILKSAGGCNVVKPKITLALQ